MATDVSEPMGRCSRLGLAHWDKSTAGVLANIVDSSIAMQSGVYWSRPHQMSSPHSAEYANLMGFHFYYEGGKR